MNYKLSFYEDGNIRIEIKDNKIFYTYKSPGFDKDNLDHAMHVFKYLSRSLKELNDEFQPERLSEKTLEDDKE